MGLLTAEDQVYSNLNSRSCEDELREILELSKVLAWYWWLAAILFAALWLIIASCNWRAVACPSCSGACQRRIQLGGQQVLERASSRVPIISNQDADHGTVLASLVCLTFVGNNVMKHRGTAGACGVPQRWRPLAPSATQTSPGGRMDRRDATTRCADRGSHSAPSISCRSHVEEPLSGRLP